MDEDLELLFQLRDPRTYDLRPMPGATLDDLDADAIAEYRRLRAAVKPGAAELKLSDRDLLYALEAVVDYQGQPTATVAGVLLFGKAPALRSPAATPGLGPDRSAGPSVRYLLYPHAQAIRSWPNACSGLIHRVGWLNGGVEPPI